MDINNISLPLNYDYIGATPRTLFFLSIVVLVYYLIYNSLGENVTSKFGLFLWFLFSLLILLNAIQYIYKMDISANIVNLFTTNPEIDISLDLPPVPEIKIKKQVFHIPENNLIYEDAKALCSAYGARLATYDEVEKAYNKGGEWCSYGWSENQMALFPTQKSTWDKLQTIEGHENDCGRPGVNGGYIDNHMARYGANCFGYKPKITSSEKYNMENTPAYPLSKKDIAFEKRVDYWKNKLTEVVVSPFNKSTWSKL